MLLFYSIYFNKYTGKVFNARLNREKSGPIKVYIIAYYSRENNSEIDIMINHVLVDIRIKVDIMKHLTNIFLNHLKDLVT